MTKLKADDQQQSLDFKINGKVFTVKCNDVQPGDRLVDFLRRTALLTGAKTMCREGGCGACVVSVTSKNPTSDELETRAINSCLVPLLQCEGLEITTAEGLGNKKDGYNPLQKQLADLNGSQCGYCSPGMVMSAYSLISSKGASVTTKDVEQALDGNLCRCTGYRPILDAFKSFAKDAPEELKALCPDLEDLGSAVKTCPRSGDPCSGKCHSSKEVNGHCNGSKPKTELHSKNWFRPADLKSLLHFISGQSSYTLVAGNTGIGIYKEDGPFDTYIDISRIEELRTVSLEPQLTVGGSVTLTDLQEIFHKTSKDHPDYWYLSILAEHVGKIGSVPIRNASTVAGNLMLKHTHNEFPSDLFIILETAGTTINTIDSNGALEQLSLTAFLKTPMVGKVIVSFALPPLAKEGVALKTFKVTPRYHNTYAYINAGFRAKFDGNFVLTEKPTLIYGGIRPDFVHAEKTEDFLTGKSLADEKTLQAALQILEQELNPVPDPPNPDPEYRSTVAQSLLYKFVLGAIGDLAGSSLKSGAVVLERGVSSGKQIFDTGKEDTKPVHQPVSKVEALAQCSGEAEFTDDIPLLPNELHAAYVLSTIANCRLKSIDPSEALKSEGVVAFFDAKNLPGLNTVIDPEFWLDASEKEELFASDRVLHAGQPLGVIVAHSLEQAEKAARLVRVEYTDIQKPVLTIREALKHPDRIMPHDIAGPLEALQYGDLPAAFSQSTMIIEGEFETGAQFHFHMEPQITRCVPTEDGLKVYAAVQDMDGVHKTIARVVGLSKNRVDMEIRRLGGAFGGKASRGAHVAVACAVCATALRQPVRMKLDMQTNMQVAGGRLPNYCKYKAGVNDDGILQAVELEIITDCGSHFNEGSAYFAGMFSQNCYEAAAWKVEPKLARTDTPRNTYCRAPGTSEGIAIIENLMEHIASVRGEDPLQFRLKNLRKSGQNLAGRPAAPEAVTGIVNQLIESSDYVNRKNAVERFNQENRWKKRGITLMPMTYAFNYLPFRYNCLVAVYHDDGSVAVTHGGIECGQGINTKIAQVVAMELGIPIEMISIKSTNTVTNPNTGVTGGSMTSELNCYAAMSACRVLKERMRPIREKLGNPDWKTLVEECYNNDVDLSARHYYTVKDGLQSYTIHGAVVTEVELDVLTGEKIIRRVDLTEDVGLSMNPAIDVGQVEGAFVMGLGLWTSEKFSYDENTGKKLTISTWNYKPPSNKDIPEDFRVTLLRNAPNPYGVLRSKATGEPPLSMGVSIMFALREAIDSARKDAGLSGWYPLNGPATVDTLLRNVGINVNQFKYNFSQ